MKKFFLLIAIISTSLLSMSQKGKVASAFNYMDMGKLDKAKLAIDQALIEESSMNWPKTFFAKGQLCQATFVSENPTFKTYYPDPLAEAYAAYEKAMELDTEGTIKKLILKRMIYNYLAVNLYNQGYARFESKDYEGALKSFETQIIITESDKYAGAKDTGMYYNAGFAAKNSSRYNVAIKYFEKCIEMNYFGIRPYIQIYESYLGLGDKVKAESYLMDLIKIFPDNKTISQLMDLNILNKAQEPESNNSIAQNILNKAHESETNNPAVKNEPIPELSITGSKYYALIIGESQYSDPLINELEKPIKDAEMVYNTLTTRYTFDKDNVKFLKNATMAQIVYAFDYFAKVVHPVDNFLIFYAGHGVWDATAEIGFWLPSDAQKSTKLAWFRNSTLRDYLREINSKHTLLISDACFGGSIFKTRSAFVDATIAINKLYELPSRKAMTSGTLTEVPDQSAFLKYLIDRLRNNNEKYLSSEQLFSNIRIAVINNSNAIPQFGEIKDVGDEGGDFIFILK